MLDRVEVIVPYSRTEECQLSRGQKFDFNGSNILLTGDIGSGKSSLLHMIARSLYLFQSKQRGGFGLDYNYVGIDERIIFYEEMLDDGELSLKRVTYELLRNADLMRLSGTPKIFSELVEETRGWEHVIHSPLEDPDYSHYDRLNDFVKSEIGDMAKLEGISPKWVYGVASLLLNMVKGNEDEGPRVPVITSISSPLTNFFYTKLIGNGINNLNAYCSYSIPGGDHSEFSVISNGTRDDLDFPNGSKGQVQGKKLDELLSRINSSGGLILLDEPMSNMDEKSFDRYNAQLLNLGERDDVQIILATHDKFQKRDLRGRPNWVEYDLSSQ